MTSRKVTIEFIQVWNMPVFLILILKVKGGELSSFGFILHNAKSQKDEKVTIEVCEVPEKANLATLPGVENVTTERKGCPAQFMIRCDPSETKAAAIDRAIQWAKTYILYKQNPTEPFGQRDIAELVLEDDVEIFEIS